MAQLDETLKYLGEPYFLTTIDGEPVISRALTDFEFEISGLRKRSFNCSLYVWMTRPHRELMGIYHGIRSKEDLKDLLGHCAVKYQNLFSRIQVEREDQKE